MQEPTRTGGLNKLPEKPDFSPSDLTDGREPRDYQSKYKERPAQIGIRIEAIYLGGLLLSLPCCILALWIGYPKVWFSIPDDKYVHIVKYGLAWLAGVMGGTLFDIKWLYHSVAKQSWHLDRRLWRVFTPHISGGLAFATVALISSGVFSVFDRKAIESGSMVVGVAFLVGYFSDSAIAKFTEIAETLFGPSRRKEKHKESRPAIASSNSSEAPKSNELEEVKADDGVSNPN